MPTQQVAMTSARTRARLVTATILRPSALVVGDQISSSDKGVLKSFFADNEEK